MRRGQWIPNRETGDRHASHPEEHTRLLTAETPALISFNIEALALTHLAEVKSLGESLQLFFDKAASDLRAGLTEDPAGVSGKIKLPDGMTRERSAKRLRFFADKVQEALDHSDDREKMESALAELYPDQAAQRAALSEVEPG